MSSTNHACSRWLEALVRDGTRVVLPEIVDYETRRTLIRIGSAASIRYLDRLGRTLDYQPLTTEAMRLAAQHWATTRLSGMPATDERGLDIDMILAAQALLLDTPESPVVVATSNVRHLAPFVAAETWQTIRP
jgi:hypothetical protein